ncbi:MAG: hypothetical protein OEZ01_14280, partial [Candidatus Heimdallarchaeota archaeon]|nr:hypothetical protein [Candidatus Heimdallarchaeota archaeon]
RRSQIRNHRSQVEGIFNLTLQDKSKLRVTTFVVTPFRAAHSTKKEIRMAILKKLEEIAAESTFGHFVNKIVSYDLREELRPIAEEVFPIKILEISKVKVIRYPEGSVLAGSS